MKKNTRKVTTGLWIFLFVVGIMLIGIPAKDIETYLVCALIGASLTAISLYKVLRSI